MSIRRLTQIAGALVVASTTFGATADNDRLERIASFFASANVVSGPEIVDCTLSGGTRTSCFSISVKPDPKDYTPGPWCPTSTADGPESGGVWIVDGRLKDVDGAFITSLAEIYGDARWQLYDPDTGAVRFTGTLAACEAAARPDVDPAYQNYCVQCLPEYLSDDASTTYVIPREVS